MQESQKKTYKIKVKLRKFLKLSPDIVKESKQQMVCCKIKMSQENNPTLNHPLNQYNNKPSNQNLKIPQQIKLNHLHPQQKEHHHLHHHLLLPLLLLLLHLHLLHLVKVEWDLHHQNHQGNKRLHLPQLKNNHR